MMVHSSMSVLCIVAGPDNTGQQIATHHFLYLLPIIIFNLTFVPIAREQALLHTLLIHKMAAGASREVLTAFVKRESKNKRSLSESIKKTTRQKAK
jgi:hypothetical protein